MEIMDIKIRTGKTNDILTDHEEKEVRTYLSDARAERAKLNAENTLDQSRDDQLGQTLSSRRLENDDQIERFQIALAPHKKMPSEILSEIFLRCASGPTKLPRRLWDFPWILGQICSRWREIVLSTPRLWARVDLYYRYKNQITPRIMDDVEICLHRSGDYPLWFKASGTFNMFGDSATFLSPIPNLIPHSNRLKFLYLAFPMSCLEQFLLLPPGSIDTLETVHLNVHNMQGMRQMDKEDRMSVFKGARSLRIFTLESHRSRLDDPSTLHLPWLQLSEFHMIDILARPELSHHVLKDCVSLEDCTLALAESETTHENLPIIVLPKLHSLVLNVESCDHYGSFLEPLVLPSLHSIRIKAWSRHLHMPMPETVHWLQADFLALITRSACSLKTFITTVSIPSSDIEALLRAMPSVVEFGVQEGQDFTASTYALLSSGELAPNLETLRCLPSSLPQFVDMLESRQSVAATLPTITSLKLIRLNNITSDEHEHVRYRLDALENNGVIVLFD